LSFNFPTFGGGGPAGGGGGGFSTVYKTADEGITNDDTLTDDADLQFPVDADSWYNFRTVMNYDCNAAEDIKFAYSIPAATSPAVAYQDYDGFAGIVWAANTTGILHTGSGVGNIRGSYYNGNFKTGVNAGTMAIQWAQNTSGANVTTLQEGSMLMFRKLS